MTLRGLGGGGSTCSFFSIRNSIHCAIPQSSPIQSIDKSFLDIISHLIYYFWEKIYKKISNKKHFLSWCVKPASSFSIFEIMPGEGVEKNCGFRTLKSTFTRYNPPFTVSRKKSTKNVLTPIKKGYGALSVFMPWSQTTDSFTIFPLYEAWFSLWFRAKTMPLIKGKSWSYLSFVITA